MFELKPGAVLAKRYALKERLAAGSHTETWLATDRMTKAAVALKISTDAARDELLRREWQVSIRLVHPHIVRVFEFNDLTPAFYSQQFIDGADLSCVAGLPSDASLPALASVTHALRYAHGKGVLHRDIKASNVLLDGNGAAYLIDFGVASDGDDDVGGGSLIASSPERLAGEKATAADDVFALGGLFYETLAGRSPYSSASTADDIRTRRPETLSAVTQHDVPAEIQDIVERMLDKRAANRPSLDEVIEVLDEMGVRPGLVPRDYVARRASNDATADIEPTSIAPTRRSSGVAPATEEKTPDGISPRVLAISLLVLLGILSSVVFFLPDAVERPQSNETPDETPLEQSEAEPVAEEAVVEEPATLRDRRVRERAETEEILGELLAKIETLEERSVERWGGLDYARAKAVYEAGDAAYLQRDYTAAAERYEEAITLFDPLLERVDGIFDQAMRDGRAALEAANAPDAISAFELAVAISANSAAAQAGLQRAKNLGQVLSLIDQGIAYERSLELGAARQSFAQAVELDPQWQDAVDGLRRVDAAIEQRDFEARMSEGISALADGDLLTARAAFRMADQLRPGAAEPADGLLQVQQELRLRSIAELEREARDQEAAEQWELAVETYDKILEIDTTLEFASEGRRNAQQMVDVYQQIDQFIAEPDQLSNPTVAQRATRLLIDMTRMPEIGPRLADQRDELSRLLKRASTAVRVELRSDNKTAVSIYKVGRLGSFDSREIELKPGTYVAVGIRPGFRDVRQEFRVGPELDMDPVVVICEEPI